MSSIYCVFYFTFISFRYRFHKPLIWSFLRHFRLAVKGKLSAKVIAIHKKEIMSSCGWTAEQTDVFGSFSFLSNLETLLFFRTAHKIQHKAANASNRNFQSNKQMEEERISCYADEISVKVFVIEDPFENCCWKWKPEMFVQRCVTAYWTVAWKRMFVAVHVYWSSLFIVLALSINFCKNQRFWTEHFLFAL